MEGFLQNMMYELPDRRDVKKAVITADVVRGEKKPKLVLRKEAKGTE
jgi:ATP-dependent protease Clp ATPase subunit